MDKENIVKIEEGTFGNISSLLNLIEFIISELENDESHRLNFDDTAGIIIRHIYDTDIWLYNDPFSDSNDVNIIAENSVDDILSRFSDDYPKCLKIYIKYLKKFVEIFNVKITNENKSSIIVSLGRLVKELLDEILTYDLSDLYNNAVTIVDYYKLVPDYEIKGLDLSKTKAKFNLGCLTFRLRHKERIKVNCTGCDVKLDTYFFKKYYSGSMDDITIFEINEELFDEKTRKENPRIFLSDIFSADFKEKFYNRTLNIKDVLTLSEEQLEELNQNQFLKYIYRPNGKHNLFQLLIKRMDIKEIIKLYTNYNDDYIYLETLLRNPKIGSYMESFVGFYTDSEEMYTFEQLVNADISFWLKKKGYDIPASQKEIAFLQQVSAEDIKKSFNDNLRAVILFPPYICWNKFNCGRYDGIVKQSVNALNRANFGVSTFHIVSRDDYYRAMEFNRAFKSIVIDEIPEEFVEENKDIFLVDSNVPANVKEKYFSRTLELEELIEYAFYFMTPSIWCFVKDSIRGVVRFVCEKYALGEITREEFFDFLVSLRENNLGGLSISTPDDEVLDYVDGEDAPKLM